jgi:hypothetical protein
MINNLFQSYKKIFEELTKTCSNICATDKFSPILAIVRRRKSTFWYRLHLVCDENAVIHSKTPKKKAD